MELDVVFICISPALPSDHTSSSKVVSSSLSLHRNLASVCGGRVCLLVGRPPGPESPETALFERAVSVLSCASYRNQILHVFLRPALLAVAMQAATSPRKGEPHRAERAEAGLEHGEVLVYQSCSCLSSRTTTMSSNTAPKSP